ncbi:MAG: long-chain fatty acid--CoA ligase [Betaproteobacteria bacterium]|nr:long-chain fatty acid--CoA ligase [Betaproteobacteria bacterium]
MQATMMDFPLTLAHIFERAGRLFPESEIVSRMPDKSLHRYKYADFYSRAQALIAALRKLGLKRGERVATLMWNHHVHLEAYFAIPCMGGVLHTLNLRLSPDDIAYIANHAQDRFLIVDDVLLPLYDKIRANTNFEKVIVVPLSRSSVPAGLENYETLISRPRPVRLPRLKEEDPAGMCYSSGTTGRPKGVVYTHRALVLHSLASALPDVMGIGNSDTVTPVVPMFHVNAWGIPFTAVMVGAKLAFPGPHLGAASLLDLYQSEQVTLTAGVPTIWAGILQALDHEPSRWKLSAGMRMVVGGAAAPESMIRAFDKFGLRVIHGWGMTETTPVAAVNYLKRGLESAVADEQYALRAKQGVPLPFVEVRAMTGQGEAPWNGTTMGELEVRGPWVAAGYHDLDSELDKWSEDGWFRTGDVVTIDARGYIKITDRIKDLVKSGGEWISSVDLENALVGHPKVAEAAVIAVSDPKWGERPLAVVVLKPGQSATQDELRGHLAPKFAKFWLPDAFEFVAEIPRTSTGKMLKAKLREQFKDWKPGGR